MDSYPENNILKITPATHFVALYSLLIVTFLLIVLLFLFDFDRGSVIGVPIAFLLQAIPSLYLHFEYWAKNKGEAYEIRRNEIILSKNGTEISYKSDDIRGMVVYLSPALYQNSNLHFLAIESYNYASITLKTGERIILTSLLHPRMDIALSQIKDVYFEKRKRLFCYIR